MNQIIPLKLLGMVALIMVCTWIFSFYLFGDETAISKYEIETISEDEAMAYTSEIYYRVKTFCENPNNWEYTIFGKVAFPKRMPDKDMRGFHACTGEYWLRNYYTGYYDEFIDFYNTLTYSKQKCILYYYNKYVSTTGKKIVVDEFDGSLAVREVKKSWLDSATDLIFHDIPDKLGEIGQLMSFGFKDKYGDDTINSDVRFILNIIFVPLWIIIFIGILPLLIALVHAIGSILDAIIPF